MGWTSDDIIERYRRGIQEATLRKALSQVVEFETTDTIGERIEKIFLQYDTIEGIQFFSFLRRQLGLKERNQGENENKRRKVKTLRKETTKIPNKRRQDTESRKTKKINLYTKEGQRRLKKLIKNLEKRSK